MVAIHRSPTRRCNYIWRPAALFFVSYPAARISFSMVKAKRKNRNMIWRRLLLPNKFATPRLPLGLAPSESTCRGPIRVPGPIETRWSCGLPRFSPRYFLLSSLCAKESRDAPTHSRNVSSKCPQQTPLQLLLEFVAWRSLFFVLQFDYIRARFRRAEQPTAEIIGTHPENVFGVGGVAVPHAREHEHIETFIGLDKGFGEPHGICHAHVVVHVAGRQHQVAFQVFGQLGIFLDIVEKLHGAVLFVHLLHAVILLAPIFIVDIVFVIA